jgi:hypothetical protein
MVDARFHNLPGDAAMTQPELRNALQSTIHSARRRIFLHALLTTLVRGGLILLPLTALLVAADQRWLDGRYSLALAIGALVLLAVVALAIATRRVVSTLRAAVAIDERAELKGRISSAWEFLAEPRLDGPRRTQVRDAVAHLASLDLRALFRLRLPRYAWLLPAFLGLLALSFFVPPYAKPGTAEAAVDFQKQRQLSEIRQLQKELEDSAKDEEELKEVLEKLKNVEKRFDRGELKERDVMIELARLDQELSKKLAELGVEALVGEIDPMVPHLMASAASRAVASNLKEEKLEEAAKEMEKLAKKAQKGELSEQDKKDLALNMGVAASKLGSKSKNSFAGDLSQASEAMKSGDGKSFESAAGNMSNKFKRVGKFKKMNQARKRIGLCKAGLGQKECASCNGEGCGMCQGLGQKPGGLKAGTGTAGDPKGERTRLEDSYKQMVKITGMAGEGPVESEVEVTEGQTSESQVDVKEVYSEYAEVAEQAIEREEIPLSHRFHVKRYFQAIRPQE